MRAWILPLIVLVGAGAVWWLTRSEEKDVVLYCAVDQDQSRPIAEAFEKETGLSVGYQPEIETQRSIGLQGRLLEEKASPQADVFWNNEYMTTVHLGLRGILDPLPPGVAETFPAEWRDPAGMAVAFGGRVRVLLVNTELLPNEADWPDSVEDLVDPKYAAMGLMTCMARPEVGTTFTHAVVLLTKDEAKAKAFFESAAKAAKEEHLKVVPGNGPSMEMARDASNKVAFSLTDTDDAWVAVSGGAKVRVVYPDQGEGQPGALLIPNSVALVKGRPHPEAAERLLRWLVTERTEQTLAAGPSAQIPLRPNVPVPAHVWRPAPVYDAANRTFRAMPVDWQATGANRDRWRDWLNVLFRPAK
jgi:iron(III) transport system substrate-binding protein